jgi:transposase-like protein
MFLERGLVFTHEAVREGEAQLAPLLSEMLRKHRRGRIGRRWYVDATYIKVKGRWTSLYRAMEREGNLVDVLLSEKRDRVAAEAFFRSVRTDTGSVATRGTADGHNSYPGAIRTELGEGVTHRTDRYLNNHLEQDHRGIVRRTHPMYGFKRFASTERFCRVYSDANAHVGISGCIGRRSARGILS